MIGNKIPTADERARLPQQRLVKCSRCGGKYPQKLLRRDNGEAYGYDKGPIVHTYWSICKQRGPLNTWCPGGGI